MGGPYQKHNDQADVSGAPAPKPGDSESAAGSVDVILPEGFGASFSERAIRARFVRKVYLILLSQLCVTFAIVATFCLTPAVKNFYCARTVVDEDTGILKCRGASSTGVAMYWGSYVTFFITYFTIACCQGVRRKFPGNMVALTIFTLALSVWAGSIAIFHDVYWVLMAVGITAALCLGLTLFSFQTKIDFTGESFIYYLPHN